MTATILVSCDGVHILPIIFTITRTLSRRAVVASGGDTTAGSIIFENKDTTR